MKRILKGLIFAFVGVLAFTLASCEEKSEHQPQLGWYRDASSHWHKCDHCDEQLDLAIHNYDLWVKSDSACKESRKCKTCGFVQTRSVDHLWGEWTQQEDGSMEKECTHCGEVASVAQYYVKGDFLPTTWAASEEGKFEIDYTTMSATITVNLAVGNQFKVGTKDGWEFGFDNVTTEEGKFEATSDGNLKALEAADYEITITGLDGSDHKVSVKQLCVHTFVWTEVADKPCNFTGVCSKCQATGSKVEHEWGNDIICDKCNAVDIVDYYIKGSFLETQWGPADANKFTVADDNKSSSYVINVKAGDEFKIGSKSGWEFNASNVTFNVPHFEGTDNIIVKADGVYMVVVSGLDTATHTVSINHVQLYVRGDAVGSWDPKAENALVYDEANDKATFELTITDATKAFKIAPADWGLLNNAFNFGAGEEGYVSNGGDIKLEAGVYIVTVSGVCHGTPALTIAAKPAGYSVTYDVNDHGTAPEALTAQTALPAKLPVLTAEGWAFEGWYTDEALTVEAVAGAEITANTVLYAKWREMIPVEGLLLVGTDLNEEFEEGSVRINGKLTPILSLYVYLKVDQVVEITNADNSFGFDFDNIAKAEGLFVDTEGALKITKEGYYTFTVYGYTDKEKATCEGVLSAEKMTIAQADAADLGAAVLIQGTVVSEENDIIVLSDGAETPATIKVRMPGNYLPGDVIKVSGNKTKDKKDATLVYISGKLVERVSTPAVEIDNHLNKVLSLEQLTDGAKVVIAYGDYVMGSQAHADLGKYREVIYSPNYKDNRAQIVTLVKNGDNWKLQVEADKYLLNVEDKNNIETGAYVEGNGDWTITITEGVLKITSVRNDDYCIQFNYNAGSLRFSSYKNTQADIELYVIQSSVESYGVSELVKGTDYKNKTLFDGAAVKIQTLSGSIKGDSQADIHGGAIQLKLDKDIDGETIKNKGLLFIAKEDCTLVLTVCASGDNKGWVVSSNDVEVASGSINKNKGAISTITLNVKAGESYRFSSPAGGIRFESVAVFKNI